MTAFIICFLFRLNIKYNIYVCNVMCISITDLVLNLIQRGIKKVLKSSLFISVDTLNNLTHFYRSAQNAAS